ncbi:putative flavin-containing monooxygenase 1 isoform X1 [Primulina tabacum]|uniref:putative flavin-containing monooxygenase 1 isoform X1 n=1 Tax=Primulina tabacum TaxID=48773 RepID=UPI003F5990D0
MEKRVAIIGAGVSGLLACKCAVSKGFKPIVFEAKDQVGGLWTQTIESTKLQNAKPYYQFSDFPWPDSVKEMFPHSSQLLEYIQSYAQHFDLLQYVKFNSEVVSIDYVGESEDEIQSYELWGGDGKAFGSKGKWNLKVHHTKEDSTKLCWQVYEAEFVILCIGRFSGLADIPEFPEGHGPEVFSGKVIHSMDYSAMDNASAANFIKGKNIVVIGSGKSAVDIAFECAQENGIEKPCTMIQRTIHWMLPDAEPWGVNFGYLFFNRFSELMIHKPGEGFFHNILAFLLTPLRWGMSKFVESYLRWKLPLRKYGMIPKCSFVDEISSCTIFFLPDKFFDGVEEGSIVLKKSKRFSFCKEGLLVDGEVDPLKTDVVFFATGYRGDQKLKNIFASPNFANIVAGTPTSSVPLYRQMIHPRIPQLAVVGYSESIANLYTFEMRCQWLSFFLDQKFQFPSVKQMENDVKMWENHMKKYAGNNMYRRACIASTHIWYNDQLCKDIGFNPRRKKGFFKDLFEPYGMADYKGLDPKS